MRCANCGYENTVQAKYCVNCSTPLNQGVNAEQVRLAALLEAGQFTAVLTAIPPQAAPDLLQLRAEAQRRFDVTADQMVALYEGRFGLNEWNERRARTALRDFREQTPAGNALDQPSEATAYADALLAIASTQIDQGAFERARAHLNALQVLPQQRDIYRRSIEALLESIPPSERTNEPSAPTTETPTLTRRLPPQADTDTTPPQPSDGPNATAAPPTNTPTQADTDTDVTAQSPADAAADEAMAQALAAIEVLEAQLKRQAEFPREILARPATERPDWNDLVTAMEQARHLVPAESPLALGIEKANERLALLRDDTRALLTALTSSLAAWFSEKAAVEQASTLLTKLEQGFGPDRAPVPVLRAVYKQRMDEVRVVDAQLKSLETLEGAALESQLKELADLQIPDSLVPLMVKRRLADYKVALEADKQAEATRKARDSRILQHREKRRELDNLYEDADPKPENFITLRNEASTFTTHPLLTSADNPLDPQTFAFYDLLFASRHRTLTVPTEEAQLVQTLQGKGEYLEAYRRLLREATQLEHGDDASAFQTTVTLRDNALADLRRNLEETTRESLALAQKSLDLFDFEAADQTLVTQRKYIKDASIEFDQGLLDALKQAEQATKKLADRDLTARALIERADQLTQPGSANPDYRKALEELDKATQTAEWLKATIERQTAQVRQRQAAFVTAQLQLADGRIKGGTPTTFAEAEKLLARAELNADTESQQQEIALLRAKIDTRRQALSQLEVVRATALGLATATLNGDELDLLPGRIRQTRVDIGPADDPKFEKGSWAELDSYLTIAETRLAARTEFNRLVIEAEQAALLGQAETLAEQIKAILKLKGQHGFPDLKFDQARALELGAQARQGSRIEGARASLYQIRCRMEAEDKDLTTEAISRVIKNTEDYNSDEEVKKDHAFLSKVLPFYQARDLLKNALGIPNFAEFDRIYSGLAPEVLTDTRIRLLKQEAEIERARYAFQKGYETLQGEASSRFRDGWDKPDDLVKFMRRLRDFAEQLQPNDRQAVPALAAAIILELDRLAETVAGARVDYDNERFPVALRRVKSALSMIPATPTDGTLLDAYASTLIHLRETLTSIKEELERAIFIPEGDEILLSGAIKEYNETVSDPQTAFVKPTLMSVRNKFTLPVKSRESQAKSARYAAILKRITDLIDTADALEDLIVSGHRPGEETPAKQSGAARLALIEQQISVVTTESEQIKATNEGAAWLGINDYGRFKALNTHRQLANTLAEAQLWLEQTKSLSQSLSDLRRLRNDAAQFNKLKVSKTEDDLKLADCMVLLNRCQTDFIEIFKRVSKINTAIKRQESLWQTIIGAGILLITLAALGLIGWNIPAVRHPIIVAMVGTLTPIPPTAIPGTEGPTVLVVTATPAPTVTPIPTPTPVPPQAGIVVVPGKANVRARPDANLARAGIVEANDDVLITGYTTASDGALWYRLDVPGRNLHDVWLLAEVPVLGQPKQTVRIEGNATLNPALQVPYQP